MKNYEKYVNKIKEYGGNNFCSMFVEPHILKPIGLSCGSLACSTCRVLQLVWLTEGEEPKEPEIDWSKVEVDTPVLVREYEHENWIRRYFAKYEGGKVYVWNNGRTSWTEKFMTPWIYAKLAEDEKEYKEPKVDWSKVEVDTPILVRDCEDVKWDRRYFAEYKDGVVYAWNCRRTSWTEDCMTGWKYAKLAESEETK